MIARGATAARDLATSARRARVAVPLVLAAVGVHYVELGAAVAGSQALESIAMLAYYATFLSAGVVFLFWVAGAHRAAAQLGAPTRFTPSQAVVGWFLPVLSLFRPYQAMRDLDLAIEPTRVPAPAPRPAQEPSGDYRTAARAAFTPRAIARAPVGVWWGLWIAAGVASFATLDRTPGTANLSAAAVYLVLETGSAIAAALVVQRIQGRLDERARRLEASVTE